MKPNPESAVCDLETGNVIVEALYVSPGHNYFGHHGMAPGEHPIQPVSELKCVAGSGIEGDRFFNFKDDYKGQITFFSREVYDSLCRELGIYDRDYSVFRRNVITSGVDLNAWIGKEFEIQGVRFLGVCECSPCYWMNSAFGPGAEVALKGRGGLRARILRSGTLRVSR
jgi:MOSC domain-containing protein YiiM